MMKVIYKDILKVSNLNGIYNLLDGYICQSEDSSVKEDENISNQNFKS
jgi:hypothetical protein